MMSASGFPCRYMILWFELLVHLLFVHQDSRLRLLQQDVVTCCHFLPFRFRQGKYLLQ